MTSCLYPQVQHKAASKSLAMNIIYVRLPHSELQSHRGEADIMSD